MSRDSGRPEDPGSVKTIALRFYSGDGGPDAVSVVCDGSYATVAIPPGATEVTVSWMLLPPDPARSGRPENEGGALRTACGHSLVTCHTDKCFRPGEPSDVTA